MCVSVCVPWGPHCVCWVRGGQGFNKGTGLVQGCQSDCLGDVQPDGVQMRATGLDVFLLDQRRVWCARYVPLFLEPLSGFTLGFEA